MTLRSALVFPLSLLFLMGSASAQELPEDDKLLSGMSIVGNDEAPKSLVIVPWKSSELGDTLDISRALGEGREPVDRDIFARELDYFAIRAGTSPGPLPVAR